jgi:hypothetical protein
VEANSIAAFQVPAMMSAKQHRRCMQTRKGTVSIGLCIRRVVSTQQHQSNIEQGQALGPEARVLSADQVKVE